MTNLTIKKCRPCELGAPAMPHEQAKELLTQRPFIASFILLSLIIFLAGCENQKSIEYRCRNKAFQQYNPDDQANTYDMAEEIYATCLKRAGINSPPGTFLQWEN